MSTLCKLSVLFIDGDRHVHQSLTRLIKAKQLPLTLLFAGSGGDAVEKLSRQPCDVVVSEARLPDMDGLDLLGRVMERWPLALRILMTAESRESTMHGLLKYAHQLMPKPIPPDQLLESLQISCRLRFLLADERLRTVVHRMKHLPVVPRIYTELTRELRKESCSVQSLGKIIAQDMSLASGILKLVNTPFFGLSRHIETPQQAVSILGANLIRGLVLSAQVFMIMDPAKNPDFNAEKLWAHSTDAARCCRAVMKSQNLDGREAEDAFLAGLLHDIGKLVLMEGCPDEYLGVLARSRSANIPVAEAEMETLGVTHAQVGGYLLGLWGFSEPVIIAIAQHHGVAHGPGGSLLTAVLHAVDVFLHDRHARSSGEARRTIIRDILSGGGWDALLGKWMTVVQAELDAAQ